MKIKYMNYRVLTLAVYLVLLPMIILFRLVSGGKYEILEQRFGFYSFKKTLASGKRIWIHASSVGETGAACAIIDEILKASPDMDIILSTVTETGFETARRLTPEKVTKIIAPLDFEPAVKRTLDFFMPDVLVLTETELWPNMIMSAAEKKIGVITVNGRISESSYKIYRRLKPFSSEVFSVFRALSMISGADSSRVISLGADPFKVSINGNSKYDQALKLCKSESETRKAALLADLLHTSGRTVITAGSTRPGEEKIILEAFQRMLESQPDALLVIAPRHIKRADEILDLPDMKSFRYSLRSSLNSIQDNRPDVIVLDTMGELTSVYRLSDVVICGGSLLPYGGQNPMEAAVLGKPLVFGPYMQDFAEEAEVLMESGAAHEARDVDGLYAVLFSIINNRNISMEMGRSASSAIFQKAGAAAKHADTLLSCLQ